jgi:hypothetical protein
MRRTYFRTGHVTRVTSGNVTDVTSGHVTFGHMTSGCSSSLLRKYDFVRAHILLLSWLGAYQQLHTRLLFHYHN